MSSENEIDPRSRFIQLFMSHEKQIYRYILSLMPHSQDAQDVLQETAIALYNKIEDFDTTRPFAPWAFRFAYHMTLKHREKSSRWHRFLDENLMKEIASRQQMLSPELDQRREYLKECLAEVPQDKRSMLTEYYFEDETVDSITRLAAMRRQELYYQWQAAMAATPGMTAATSEEGTPRPKQISDDHDIRVVVDQE